jgi:3-hydroxyacyl-CoA dehydrogenase
MVEVVRGDMDIDAFGATVDFLNDLGRSPVETRDISGFVSNSVLMFYAVMALRLLEVGARVEDVDRVARNMKTLPPFLSFDSWRPSIVEDVTRIMNELRGDGFLRSSRLLSTLAKDNPKFYVDQKPNEKISARTASGNRKPDDENIRQALQTAIRIAAARLVELGESPTVVDFVSTEGVKIPIPPLASIDERGASEEIRALAEVNELIGGDSLPAPQLLTRMASANETFFKNGQPNPWLLSHQAS